MKNEWDFQLFKDIGPKGAFVLFLIAWIVWASATSCSKSNTIEGQAIIMNDMDKSCKEVDADKASIIQRQAVSLAEANDAVKICLGERQ
jgi:hypothetical protein